MRPWFVSGVVQATQILPSIFSGSNLKECQECTFSPPEWISMVVFIPVTGTARRGPESHSGSGLSLVTVVEGCDSISSKKNH